MGVCLVLSVIPHTGLFISLWFYVIKLRKMTRD